jgi:nucleoside phosphorylase
LAAVRGRRGAARVALLTVTEAEFQSVREIFQLRHNLAGTPYFVQAQSLDETYDLILLRHPSQTNTVANETARSVIDHYKPEFLVIIGTCGGHSARNVTMGDVVVAEYVDYSGYWKYSKKSVLLRKVPHDHPSGYLLQNFVEPLRVAPDEWIPRITEPRPQAGIPSLIIGGIASGDILFGDPGNREQKRIMKFFDKANAFEMEAYGVARAVYNARSSVHYNPQFLVVRGVSDLVDRDAEENNGVRVAWTPYAVASAAVVAKVLTERLLAILAADSSDEPRCFAISRES